MKIKVLGCSGAELINFSPPAFLLDDKILLDGGTITSALREDAQKKISHILTTHAHLDHIRGIPSLADNMLLRNRKHTITLVGVRKILQMLKENLFNNTVWPDFITRVPSPAHPALKLKTIKIGESFKIFGYRISAERVNHSIMSVGYIIQNSKGKKLIYTGDTGISCNLWKKANTETGETGIDAAIIEVTFPNNMRELAVITRHLTPAMLFNELKKLNQLPRKIFITHMKPQFSNIISRELRNLKLKNLTILKQGKTYVV
jgi:ribonuclease BN (tRNA processing enzyme)